MATFLDLSLFSYFGSIFIFLFIFALLFSILNKWGGFKGVPGEKGVYGLIALSIALLGASSKSLTVIISVMAPWFTVLLVFLFLLFVVFSMFSGSDTSLMSEGIKSPGVMWTIIIIGVIIAISSLSSTYGQGLLDEQGVPASNIDQRNDVVNRSVLIVDNFDQNQANTIVHRDTSQSTSSGDVVPGTPGSTATNNFDNNVLGTIIHPKVMGLLAMMFIAFFAILLIARTPDPDT